MFVYIGAIDDYRFGRRAREGAPQRAFDAGTKGIVIGVENEFVVGIEEFIVGYVLVEEYGFVEPTGVAEVSFRRTDIGDGLRNVVFGGKGLANAFAELSYSLIIGAEV